MIEIPDVLSRFADDLLARPSGPFAFRFVLQPIMATLLALRDGTKDARAGRTPYFATVVRDPDRRRELLAEGLKATARVGAIGLALDTVYQLVVLHRFYPGEALVMAHLTAGLGPQMHGRVPARGHRNRIAFDARAPAHERAAILRELLHVDRRHRGAATRAHDR